MENEADNVFVEENLAKKQIVSDLASTGALDENVATEWLRHRTKPATALRNGTVHDAVTAASVAMKFRNLAARASSIPSTISHAVEATQAAWLTWQDLMDQGKHTTENALLKRLGSRGYIKAAWKGKITVSNDDLVKGAIGLELFNQFNGFKASPSSRGAANAIWLGTDAAAIGTGLAVGGPIGGFFAAAMVLPSHFHLDSLMKHRTKQGLDPSIRVTDYLGMAADTVIDPLFALSFTPVQAFSNPVTRKLLASAPVTKMGKPFKSILDSRAAGAAYAWFREPINVLSARIHRPIIDAVTNFQIHLKDNTRPMLQALFSGQPVLTASVKLAYKQFTTKAGMRASTVGGVAPLRTNVAKIARITAGNTTHYAAEILGTGGKVPANLTQFVVRGRRFVYDPITAPSNIQTEIADVLARRVGIRDLGNDIFLYRAMGWTDADINRHFLIKKIPLGRVNHAWAGTIGSQAYATTAGGRVSKTLSSGLPEWIRGGDFDQRVGMYLTDRITKAGFTKQELPWLREAERVVQQFRLDAGLPSAGKLKDVWPKLLNADQYVPSDVVGNISIKTLSMIKMAKRSTAQSLGALPRESFSGMAMLEDFGYMSGRSKFISPILNRFNPGTVNHRTPTGRPISKVTNPEWIGLSGAQQRYFEQLMFRMSGKPNGPLHDAFDETMGNAFHWINEKMEPAISRRILRYYAGKSVPNSALARGVKNVAIEAANFRLPEIDPLMKLTFAVQHNIIRAMLGGKISTAIQNSAIVINSAAAEGTPAVIKGIFRMSDKKWQKAIKDSNLDIMWTQINETTLFQKHIGSTMDEFMFSGFNFTEILGKGIAGQLVYERTMKKLVNAKTGKPFKDITEWLAHAAPDQLASAMHSARWAAIDQTHLYGMLGRAPAADGPFIRPATTLLSFSAKQGEFLLRQMKRDPSGLVRYFATSGFLIKKMDDYLGVDATPFVGLGFLPMTKTLDGFPLIASPEVQTFVDLLSSVSLLASDDPRGAVTHLRGARNGLLAMAGVPISAGRDWSEAWEEWNTGARPYGAEKFVESSKPEAIRRIAFSRSSIDRDRSNMNVSIASSTRRLDFEMNLRAKAWADAVTGTSADAVNDASALMLRPIMIDGVEIPIDMTSLNARVKAKLTNRTTDADTQRWSDIPKALRFLYGDKLETYERLKNREVRYGG